MIGVLRAVGALAFDALTAVSSPVADRIWAETTYLAEIARHTAAMRHLLEDTRNLLNTFPVAANPQASAVDDLGVAGGPDRAGQPFTPAEVPAGSELRAHSSAGHQNLTGDSFMDAARGCRSYSLSLPVHLPGVAAYWNDLADQLEAAAVALIDGPIYCGTESGAQVRRNTK